MQFLRRSPLWFLALGLVAVAVHAVAGVGLMPVAGGGQDFVAELCTSHGLVSPAPADGEPDAARHCCHLCAGGGPLPPARVAAVPPTLTFIARLAAADPHLPATASRLAHPPRGPPAAV